MRRILGLLAVLTLLTHALQAKRSFLAEQKRYPRVRAAIKEKDALVRQRLKAVGIKPGELNVLMVAYKDEGELELYAKKKSQEKYELLATYAVCAKSGELGPKSRQGDRQVPEGLYHIDRFNPSSSYHLSLGLNYPNAADRRRSNAKQLGGDIFIHGKCVTIGCLPMTDDRIKEIYLYAVYARNAGQGKIPVYIFPCRMTEEHSKELAKLAKGDEELLAFWSNLNVLYKHFVSSRKEVKYTVGKGGEYVVPHYQRAGKY